MQKGTYSVDLLDQFYCMKKIPTSSYCQIPFAKQLLWLYFNVFIAELE